jgi:isopenicillin N synthase-like dioxygenase
MAILPNGKLSAGTIHDLHISTNLADAAQDILKHSFAVYKVPTGAAQTIKVAWNEARQFFAEPSTDCQKIVNGNLYGYNEPSNAKKLFRAFCFSNDQPWPTASFQTASTNVAKDLHHLLVQCYQEIKQQQSSFEAAAAAASERTEPPLRKRPRLSSVVDIPPTAWETTKCPLDFFFYHAKDPSAVNCSEHIDRGILIGVCLTNVPGLEVQIADAAHRRRADDKESSLFVCPEIVTHNSNLYQEAEPCSGLVCIMAGDQLSQMVSGTNGACVHRVRENLKRARLSISYELRI